ncbi:hypothetical protein [Celeribacter halophilus]|uniref:hypothetical protein n=1 Tax=Celeribacter halophilus TaxID=576117 RepID=UPI002FCE9D9A
MVILVKFYVMNSNVKIFWMIVCGRLLMGFTLGVPETAAQEERGGGECLCVVALDFGRVGGLARSAAECWTPVERRAGSVIHKGRNRFPKNAIHIQGMICHWFDRPIRAPPSVIQVNADMV